MISVSDLRRNDFRLRFETEIIPSLFRDGIETEIPSQNRDGIISVSNLRRKSFRLYLETEIETELFPSRIGDGNNSVSI